MLQDAVKRLGVDGSDLAAVRGVHLVLFVEVCLAVLVSYVFNVFVTSVIGATVYGQSNAQLVSG